MSDAAATYAEQVRAQKIAALEQTYPAWQIHYLKNAESPMRWWANRHAPLTDQQRAAGLVPCIARSDIVSLAMELTVQGDIADRLGQ